MRAAITTYRFPDLTRAAQHWLPHVVMGLTLTQTLPHPWSGETASTPAPVVIGDGAPPLR